MERARARFLDCKDCSAPGIRIAHEEGRCPTVIIGEPKMVDGKAFYHVGTFGDALTEATRRAQRD